MPTYYHPHNAVPGQLRGIAYRGVQADSWQAGPDRFRSGVINPYDHTTVMLSNLYLDFDRYPHGSVSIPLKIDTVVMLAGVGQAASFFDGQLGLPNKQAALYIEE